MTALTDRLDAIAARAEAATEGPWFVDRAGVSSEREGFITRGCYDSADAEFIAASRTDVPALVAALRAVLGHMDNVEQTSGVDYLTYKAIREVIATALNVSPVDLREE